MTEHKTREEILNKRRIQRAENLELYRLALEKLEKQDKKLQEEKENELQKEREQRLKEREERQNRFLRASNDKRQKKHSLQEQELGMTLEEHKQNITNKQEEEHEAARKHTEELEQYLSEKRSKRQAEIKPKRQRAPRQDTLGLTNVIKEKVDTWYNEFLHFANGKTGTEFFAYTKSEDGADEFQRLMAKYNKRISIISRKNEHVVELRKQIFQNYLINLF